MRVHKFRGKSKMSIEDLDYIGIEHKNGWVYGNLIHNGGYPYIVGGIVESSDEYIHLEYWVPVHPTSVGQYTGIKDMHQEEIYEKDVLKVPSINEHIHGDYAYQEVIYRNGTWIVQYVRSEKGQILPRGYTAGILIDCCGEYDHKNIVFDDGYLNLLEVEVVGDTYDDEAFNNKGETTLE